MATPALPWGRGRTRQQMGPRRHAPAATSPQARPVQAPALDFHGGHPFDQDYNTTVNLHAFIDMLVTHCRGIIACHRRPLAASPGARLEQGHARARSSCVRGSFPPGVLGECTGSPLWEPCQENALASWRLRNAWTKTLTLLDATRYILDATQPCTLRFYTCPGYGLSLIIKADAGLSTSAAPRRALRAPTAPCSRTTLSTPTWWR